MKKKNILSWTPVKKTEICATRVFSINEVESLSPFNERKTFVTLSAPKWVIVIPRITDQDGNQFFLMVTQWRHGSANLSVEFPGGVVDEGETPEEAAARELLEETGKKAQNLIFLGEMYPNPAIMENKNYIFFADCKSDTAAQNLDEDEFLEATMIPVQEVLDNMGTPPYDHALMSTALFLYLKHTKVIGKKQA